MPGLSRERTLLDLSRKVLLKRRRASASTRRLELIPSAKRLLQSLREIGYDLPTAVADLVDNSIAARAHAVHIDVQFLGDLSYVRIADDGKGMDPPLLREAMRFGTRRRYSASELGKFGLGLKAASLSQCRLLTVGSRPASPSSRPTVCRWDLDHVERTNRWEVLQLKQRDWPLHLAEPLKGSSGTVVIWEKLDRLMRFSSPDGRRAEADLARAAAEVAAHLAMVFHRFLTGQARRADHLVIFVNGNRVQPWDPFARTEPSTIVLPQQVLRLEREKQLSPIFVQPYVLPPEAQFSSAAAHRRAAGPMKWNRHQGFYFYRNDRLIQTGGWSRLRTFDEHTKLARVSVDFPSSADSAFQLNVSKTQVRIPSVLRAEMAAIASSAARVAQEVYKRSTAESVGRPVSTLKVDAAHRFVRMVLSAIESLLHQELDSNGVVLQRILTRIYLMEEKLHRDLLAAAVPAGDRAGPPVPLNDEAVPLGTDAEASALLSRV